MKQKNVLFGFHRGTNIRFPEAFTEINQRFQENNLRPYYLCIKDLVDGYSLSIPETFVQLGSIDSGLESPLASRDSEHWIEKIAIRGDLSLLEAKSRFECIVGNANYILDRIQPSCFLGWNTVAPPYGIYADLCDLRKIPVYSLEAGIIPGSWRIDKKNFIESDFSDSPISSEDEELGRSLIASIDIDETSLYRQSWELDIGTEIAAARKAGKKIILVLGAFEPDIGVIPAGRDSERVLPSFASSFEIAQKLNSCSDFQVIFKSHPLWNNRFPGSESCHSNILVSRSEPISLIRNSDLVVTVSSKLEATCVILRKPLLKVGPGYFNNCNIGARHDGSDGIREAAMKVLEAGDLEQNFKNLCGIIGHLHYRQWLLFPSTLRDKFPSLPDPLQLIESMASDVESSFDNKDHLSLVMEINAKTVSALQLMGGEKHRLEQKVRYLTEQSALVNVARTLPSRLLGALKSLARN